MRRERILTSVEVVEEDKPLIPTPFNGGGGSNSSSSDSSRDDCESTLEGNVALKEPNLNIKAKKGVTLKGLGSKLSGLYFVEEVNYNFSNSGLTQDITVSRDWIGESMKGGNTPPPKPKPTPPKPEVKPPQQSKTYTIKKGDTLWAIAKKYYGKGSDYPKIYNANKDKIKNPDLIYPGQVITIP